MAADSGDTSLPAQTWHIALEVQVPMVSGQTCGGTLGAVAGSENEFLRAFEPNGIGVHFLVLPIIPDKPVIC